MSYILDALKKSEQDRQAGAVPILQTMPRVVAGRRRLWLGVFIALVVVLSAAVWLTGPRWLEEARSMLRIQLMPDGDGNPPATTTVRPQTAKPGSPESSSGTAAARPESPPTTGDGAFAGPGALEPALQARLKNLSVDVVSYSEDPERRFAMIDQRIVRESETVGDGFVVKRIRPQGVVLEVGSQEVLLQPR